MIEIIGTYGFPIFMVLWFMFRTETIIKDNTQAIRDLKEEIKNGRRKN